MKINAVTKSLPSQKELVRHFKNDLRIFNSKKGQINFLKEQLVTLDHFFVAGKIDSWGYTINKSSIDTTIKRIQETWKTPKSLKFTDDIWENAILLLQTPRSKMEGAAGIIRVQRESIIRNRNQRIAHEAMGGSPIFGGFSQAVEKEDAIRALLFEIKLIFQTYKRVFGKTPAKYVDIS